jgi:hypothetical protein
LTVELGVADEECLLRTPTNVVVPLFGLGLLLVEFVPVVTEEEDAVGGLGGLYEDELEAPPPPPTPLLPSEPLPRWVGLFPEEEVVLMEDRGGSGMSRTLSPNRLKGEIQFTNRYDHYQRK